MEPPIASKSVLDVSGVRRHSSFPEAASRAATYFWADNSKMRPPSMHNARASNGSGSAAIQSSFISGY
jgi:hypothetical protein